MDDKALTVSELAVILQVSGHMVYRYAADGTIPAFRVGRSWRFWLADVKRALEAPSADPWAKPIRKKIR